MCSSDLVSEFSFRRKQPILGELPQATDVIFTVGAVPGVSRNKVLIEKQAQPISDVSICACIPIKTLNFDDDEDLD